MKPADQEMLRDAIARNAGAVVSLPAAAGTLRHHKTRLLAAEDDGFWVEAPAGEKALFDTLMASGVLVGLALKSAAVKVVFTTLIRQFRGALQVKDDTAVQALLLAWPTELKAIQRRSDHRVGVSRDVEITVQLWRIPDHHLLRDRPAPAARIDADLRDLSTGGMSVNCTLKPDAPPLAVDQRLRIAICLARDELILEGRVRHARDLPTGDVRVGVQFRKLEDGIEGRQTLATLTQIVGLLQRDEIRRRRLTGPSTPRKSVGAEPAA